ncbi:MAG: (d)CMP kinase [Eubacteriales bacterium]|nr:(d)CMP kinase [Eubacteriales bacterium]MDD4390619.1 (d)CMP kinase [Eubacteriales bacterium]
MGIVRIAIDGPSGAGKSTIAKRASAELGIEYIDTGAMYRAIAYKMNVSGIATTDEAAVEKMLAQTAIDFVDGNIIVDGRIINDEIRTHEISGMASKCSALGIVRMKLVELQKFMAQQKSVIMDGRDIGTNVIPDAEYKFFITATPKERAGRRFAELSEKGQAVTYERVLADIIERDYNDTTRKLNPLKKAHDALEIDTTGMNIEDVTNIIIQEVKKHGNIKTI